MVRCSNCGSAVSEWAALCPACRADLADAIPIRSPTPAPAPATDPGAPGEPLRPTARPAQVHAGPAFPPVLPTTDPGPGPRARARLGAAAAAVAAASVLAAVAVPGGASAERRPLAPPDLRAYTVVTTGSSGVVVIPLDGRSAFQPVATPVGEAVPTTDGVAFVRAGEAEVLPPPFSASPRSLGPADRIFPMPGLGTVGVSSMLARGGATVSYVDVDTGTSLSSPAWELPPGYRAVGQYLAEGPGGRLQVWAPVPGPSVVLGPVFGRALSVVGVDDTMAAWFPAGVCRPGRECPLQLTFMGASGQPGPTVEAAPPAGHRGFLPGGAISPDGRHLAAFVSDPGSRRAQLTIVDLTTLQSRAVPGSAVPVGTGTAEVRWAPDGAAVFFGGPGGPMHGYRLDDARAVTLDLDGSSGFDVF